MCLCFGKSSLTFEWINQFGQNFQGLVDLGVGSTSAQSPPVMTGPGYSPFPCSLSPPWLLVLMDHDIPFFKAFDVLNKCVGADFLFWALAYIFSLCKWKPLGGQTNLRIGQFFIK